MVMSPNVMYFTVNHKTVFLPFRSIYPECYVLIEKHERVHPLLCMKADCPANKGCIEVMAKRVNYWFTHIEPNAKMLIAYFKYRDRPNSIRAGIFHSDLREPVLRTLNYSAFEKFRKEDGIIKHFVPTQEYNNINGVQQLPAIIPVENLIRK